MHPTTLRSAAAFALLTLVAAPSHAAGFDAGNTAWVIVASAFVLFMMIPGLALFYGGLVRTKNVLSVLMHCIALTAVGSVIWLACGYSLAFGTTGMEKGVVNLHSFVGTLDKAFLRGLTVDSAWGSIPEAVFFVFQLTFAVITPGLIVGAFAERMKFSAMLLFSALWMLLVYVPVAHMVWGGDGGFFWDRGVYDFAGGIVVHLTAGIAALIACIAVGPRLGYGRTAMLPHNLTMCFMGTGMLWVGWFGFNAGSALSASGLAALAFVNTATAASSATLAWAAIEMIHRGKPTALGAATAAVAGLVAITPACGNVSPLGAILVGVSVSAICYAAVTLLKPLFGYDDSLDAFGVHGIGGAWGAVATALFATSFGAGVESRSAQLLIQLEGVAFVALFAPLATWALLKGLAFAFGGLRVDEEAEFEGLDLVEHSESAYALGGGASVLERPASAPGERVLELAQEGDGRAREAISRAMAEAKRGGFDKTTGAAVGVGIVVSALAGWYAYYKLQQAREPYVPKAAVR